MAGDHSSSSSRPDDATLADVVKARGAELIGALDAHLPGAAEHADATGAYAFAAAAGIGLDRGAAELCRETAKLHDIGKVYVPAESAARPYAQLDPGQRELLDGQAEAGARLALGAGIPEQVCAWILQTRERFDGLGPDGLRGDSIPITARITRAACACDEALIGASGDAPARFAMARAQLRSQTGRELDPNVVEALIAVLRHATG